MVLYRSPTGNFDSFCELLCDNLDVLDINIKILVCGDYNVNFDTAESYTNQLLNIHRSFGLTDVVKGPTRITSTSSTRIDNVFTNIAAESMRVSVFNPLLSDHEGIHLTCIIETASPREVVMCRPLTGSGIQKFIELTRQISFDKLHNLQGVNLKCEYLLQQLSSNYKESFPLKCSSSSSKHNPWYSQELKNKKESLNLFHEAANQYGNSKDVQLYRERKLDYRMSLKQAKVNYNDGKIVGATNKQKAAWEIVRSETPNPRIFTGSFTSEDYNSFTIGSIEELLKGVTISHGSSNCSKQSSTFFLQPVTVDEVRRVISGLKSTKSQDVYELSSFILKEVSHEIADVTAHITNCCFSEGVFPDCLKVSKIVPVFKKGQRTEMSNYRSIAIVPILGKIIEILLSERLRKFCEKFKIFTNSQYGYREKLSTITAAVEMVSTILSNLENRKLTKLTLYDLTRAFDCVNHRHLNNKLEDYGIRGIPLKLIQSYLVNRRQYVNIRNDTSSIQLVKHGVPQGSVLGPLLFILFINNLPKSVGNARVYMYADDSTTLVSHKNSLSLNDLAETVGGQVSSWISNNGLVMNNNKTQSLVVSLSTQGNLERSSVQFLGLTIDTTLSWQQHVENLKKKLSTATFVIRKLSNCLSIQYLRDVYFALFHARLSYGILLWGGSSHSHEVFLAQKRVVRVLFGLSKYESCRGVFRRGNIMTVACQYIYTVLVHMRSQNLELQADIHSYNTRTAQLVRLPSVRLSKSLHHFQYVGIKLLNKLPPVYCEFPVNRFKTELKQLLIDKEFYDLSEFFEHNFMN